MLMPKPLSEMSQDEMMEWVRKLQSEREALRDEAVKANRQRAVRASVEKRQEEIGEKKEKKPRTTSTAKQLAADMLAMMMKGD